MNILIIIHTSDMGSKDCHFLNVNAGWEKEMTDQMRLRLV